MSTTHPLQILGRIRIDLIEINKFTLAGISWEARVIHDTRFQDIGICVIVSHEHVIYGGVPTSIYKAMHLFITVKASEAAAAHGLHWWLCLALLQSAPSQIKGKTLLSSHFVCCVLCKYYFCARCAGIVAKHLLWFWCLLNISPFVLLIVLNLPIFDLVLNLINLWIFKFWTWSLQPPAIIAIIFLDILEF